MVSSNSSSSSNSKACPAIISTARMYNNHHRLLPSPLLCKYSNMMRTNMVSREYDLILRTQRKGFFTFSSFTSKSLLRNRKKEGIGVESKGLLSELSPQAQTGIFISGFGALLIFIPNAIVYVKEHYIADDDDSDDNSTAVSRPDVYEDIDFVDDEVLSGLSTRVILDYIFEKDSRGKTEGEENQVLTKASRFLSEAIYNEKTETALKNLVLSVLRSEEVLQELNILATKVFSQLFQDENTLEQVTELLKNALAHESIRDALHRLVIDLLNDEFIFQKVLDLISRITDDEQTKKALTDVLKNATHRTLNDEGIMQHTKEFTANLVTDSTIQRTGGDALWNTIGYSISPSQKTTIALIIAGLTSVSIGIFALSMSGGFQSRSFSHTDDVFSKSVSTLSTKIPSGTSFASMIFSPFAKAFSFLYHLPSNISSKIVNIAHAGFCAARNGISMTTTKLQQSLNDSAIAVLGSMQCAINSALNLIATGTINITAWSVQRCKVCLIDIGGYTENIFKQTFSLVGKGSQVIARKTTNYISNVTKFSIECCKVCLISIGDKTLMLTDRSKSLALGGFIFVGEKTSTILTKLYKCTFGKIQTLWSQYSSNKG